MLSEQDKARVAAAIRSAETKTAGEIFCVVAHASSGYHLVPIAWAAVLALVVPWPLIYFTPLAAGIIYLIQLAVFVAAGAVLSLGPVRYRVVPVRQKRERAHVEAMRQFLAQGLHLTAQRTGVLIFVSLAEHHAEIVADENISAKVAPAVWQEAVDAATGAIAEGRFADGLVSAVERCGAVLSAHFPPGAINHDELPNKVVEIYTRFQKD